MNKKGFSLDSDKFGGYLIVVLFAVIVISGLVYAIMTKKLPALADTLKSIFGFG